MRKIKQIGIVLLCCALLAGCGNTGPTQAEQEKPEETAPVEEKAEVQEESSAFSMPGGESLISEYEIFDVSSENLRDGVWDDVISNTDKGENKSPQISWEPVEGAESYVVFMVDTSTQYWMHWKSEGVTETMLPLGWASEAEYVGPYPPAGSTHIYEIYVIAIRNPVERVKGGLNSANIKFPEFITALDTDAEEHSGNIISCGHIAGTYSN